MGVGRDRGMSMNKASCLGLAVAALLAAGEVSAQDEAGAGAAPAGAVSTDVISSAGGYLTDRLSVDGYLGYLTGESTEKVYDANGARESRLDWKIDDALIVGTRVNYRATNWLAFELGGWTSLAADATMDDYDWLLQDRKGWSDWSHHKDTDLTRAFEVDFAARGRVLERDGYWIDGLLGYQLRNYKFRASNGDYTYSVNGWRDTRGSFSGPQVDYAQWWRTPYIGVQAGYAMPGLRLSGKIMGSPFAQASDSDLHIATDTRFRGDFDTTKMMAVGLRAERDFGPGWTLSGEADWQRFWEARGDLSASNVNFPSIGNTFPNGAGAGNQTLILSLGLGYRF